MKLYLNIFLIFIFCYSCQMPTAQLKKKVQDFQEKYSSHFKMYEVKGRRIRLVEMGHSNSPPLLFIHGSPGSWDGWIEYLTNSELIQKFHILAIDRPGYGRSDNGVVDISLKSQAEQVVGALKYNHSGLPAILVGHSFGGPVAARMAIDYPDLIKGILFLASSIDPNLEETKWFQYPASWTIFRWMIPNELLVCNDEIRALKSELLLMEPFWKNIKANVSIVHGEIDELVPVQNVDCILSHLKQNQLRTISRVSDLNHFVPWKRVDLVLKGIQSLE